MDELVALVAEKTGLSPELSQTAAETVLDFLKARLPEPLPGQIDTVLGRSSTSSGEDAANKMVRSLFGKE